MKVVAYVPLKLNNDRLPNKNTKPFDNGRPLLSYIFETLTQTSGLDAIYAYCSDDSICQYLPEKVQYLSRDTELDRSETLINQVMLSFAHDVQADVYVLANATVPFLKASSIELGIDKVVNGNYDSALTVLPHHDFFWVDNKPFNYDPANIPRTQDMQPMYSETTGLYIYKRDILVNQNRRVGQHPYLISVTKIEAIDINESIDFEMANAIAKEMYS
jgi:CMP-N-acetylneuraminic acid synthetase